MEGRNDAHTHIYIVCGRDPRCTLSEHRERKHIPENKSYLIVIRFLDSHRYFQHRMQRPIQLRLYLRLALPLRSHVRENLPQEPRCLAQECEFRHVRCERGGDGCRAGGGNDLWLREKEGFKKKFI